MENQNETTFQKSCLSFIETLFPDESFHFLEESRAMDAFGHHGIQLFFSSELRTLKFSLLKQTHQRYDRVFVSEKTVQNTFFRRLLEATYEESQLYIDHVVKTD
ncbi:hypothetical protein AS033_01020 [Exiguobacterium indicum]|uniref:Uncharacterized protein n=1 Tax=Exiguobacterium indicum TaxID=296995 RepID=A0A0V8GIA7_9BACL|nr:hypothetical protein AS033_01020 [Exiguobacterium enclense]KTR28136.1 hypothetical protein RSA11_02570 [Exiguobacterium indicum]SDB87443.1 hypothetical protein SAMN05216342_0210 [Exiguobacterium enclense]